MKTRKIPMRMCVGCREMKEKKALLRIVKAPDTSDLSCDLTGKKPGRGVYLCFNDECLTKAFKHKQFDRVFGITCQNEIIEDVRAVFQVKTKERADG